MYVYWVSIESYIFSFLSCHLELTELSTELEAQRVLVAHGVLCKVLQSVRVLSTTAFSS